MQTTARSPGVRAPWRSRTTPQPGVRQSRCHRLRLFAAAGTWWVGLWQVFSYGCTHTEALPIADILAELHREADEGEVRPMFPRRHSPTYQHVLPTGNF